MKSVRPLVLGDHTQGLGIVRSLGWGGVKSTVVADRFVALARFSKYVARYDRVNRHTLRRLRNPHVRRTFLAFLQNSFKADGPFLPFPVHEDLVHFLYEYRSQLSGVFYIPDNRMEDILDKHRFSRTVSEAGLLSPTTTLMPVFSSNGSGSVKKYLLKGRRGNEFRYQTGQKCIFWTRGAAHSMELLTLPAEEILVQEYICSTRPIFSFCGFSVEGEIDAHFMYEKLRQHPNTFGTGTVLRSTRIPDLLEAGKALIAHLSYTGVFEIEFVWDDARNRFAVIEMNPRTWKSIHFATQCGQNFPIRYLQYVNEGIRTPSDRYDEQKVWVDMGTHIPQELKRLHLKHLTTRFDFECVWEKADPAPAIAEIVLAPAIALGI